MPSWAARLAYLDTTEGEIARLRPICRWLSPTPYLSLRISLSFLIEIGTVGIGILYRNGKRYRSTHLWSSNNIDGDHWITKWVKSDLHRCYSAICSNVITRSRWKLLSDLLSWKYAEHRIDAYLLVRTTFHGRSSSTRLEGHSGSMLRIWRRYASGSIPFRRQVPAFPATSRNLSAEAGIRGKNALPGHESPGHWSSNQSRFSQHGTNIFGEKLVTGSWSAQRVSNQCS